jgi:membrane-bound inhibitor of C-type lysozyme
LAGKLLLDGGQIVAQQVEYLFGGRYGKGTYSL